MSGMSFLQRVTDYTYQHILPTLVDNVNGSNILFARTLAKPSDWLGPTMWQNITTANSATGGSYAGMDVFPTAATNNTTKLVYHPAAFEQSVVIPGLDKAINSGKGKQAISMVTVKMDEAHISASNSLGTQVYGFGLGKDIDGLGNIVDNGTNSTTYGDLLRSTNPAINADVTTVLNGVITLDYLSSEFDNVSATGDRRQSPTIGLMPTNIWTFIEGLMQPFISAKYESTQAMGYDRVDGGIPIGTSVRPGDNRLGAIGGFNSITYRDRPLVADDKATPQTYFWLNEYFSEFGRLLQDGLQNISSTVKVTESTYKDHPMPSAFQWRDFMKSINQNGEIGLLLLAGNFFHRQPRRQGKLITITSN